MGIRLRPNSEGRENRPAPLREHNTCHHPAGSPKGGQFCSSKDGGNWGQGGRVGNLPERAPGSATAVPSTHVHADVRYTLIPEIADNPKGYNVIGMVDRLGPAFKGAVTAILKNSDEAKRQLDAFMQGLAKDIGAVEATMKNFNKVDEPVIIPGPIKGLHRIVEKSLKKFGGDVSRVLDIVRTTIAVNTPEEAHHVAALLAKRMDLIRGIDDTFDAPSEERYRDIKLNPITPNGIPAEILIITKDMLAAKEGRGHTLYGMTRSMPPGPKRLKLIEEQQQLYESAHTSSLARPVFMRLKEAFRRVMFGRAVRV